MPEETHLDLDKVTIFGHEKVKSDLVIDSIVRGIEAGDDIPAVEVTKIDENTYEILDGHRRVVGHYIVGEPLKVVIAGERKELGHNFDLRQTLLVDDHLIDKDGVCEVNGRLFLHVASYDFTKEKDPNYK